MHRFAPRCFHHCLLAVNAHTIDAEYIILNIFCDDHERNLVSWCDMRGGSRTLSGFTRPHLRVNVGEDKFEECCNVCTEIGR